MKKITLLLIAIFSILTMEVRANESIVSMHFSITDFTFDNLSDGETYIYSKDLNIHYSESGEPCLPYFTKTVAMPGNYTYKSFSSSVAQTTTIRTNTILANAPEVLPTNAEFKESAKSLANYDIRTYPTEHVCLSNISRWNNMTVLYFEVCPFTYDAKTRTLRFSSIITININYDIINKAPSLDGYTFSPSLLLQYYDYNFGFPPSYDDKEPEYGENDVEYLIVTCNQLKKSFQPLADWKKKKGIRSKIISVEEIIQGTAGNTLQLKIKNALHRYYKKNKLKYVLLGGDNNIIPSLPCYCKALTANDSVVCRDIPSDIFYACFDGDFNWDANGNKIYGEIDDSVNFTPSIYISRIPVKTTGEVENFVNKTILYEQNPQWGGQMLMAGVQLGNKFDNKSDSEHFADMLYEKAIKGRFNGNVNKFFDTYCTWTDDDLLDVTADNLKHELSRAYYFIDVDTHGGDYSWSMEKDPPFESKDASTYSSDYNSVIITGACDTNAFDKLTDGSPCLSKAFLDNPNNGVIAYLGSSRAGWYSISRYSLGSSLIYEESFYKYLFDDNNTEKSFAGSTTQAKRKNISTCNRYGSMRWLQLALNPIGDPEMQIYTDVPREIPFTISEFANGDSIRIETTLKDCRICAYSTSDLGKTLYKVFNNTSTACFENIDGAVTAYVTKNNYKPTTKILNQYHVVLPPWIITGINNNRQSKNMRIKYSSNRNCSNATITISDTMGNIKASYPLDSNYDFIEVDTSGIGTGIRIINLVVDGTVCDTKKETF